MADEIRRWRPRRAKVRPSKERAHYTTAQWRTIRAKVLARDCLRCRSCGIVCSASAHVDHILPLEDGGSDDEGNLQTLCRSCHGRKTRNEQRQRGYLK
jgi:5-methylcytosine-specific restriction endonuclease McrA